MIHQEFVFVKWVEWTLFGGRPVTVILSPLNGALVFEVGFVMLSFQGSVTLSEIVQQAQASLSAQVHELG